LFFLSSLRPSVFIGWEPSLLKNSVRQPSAVLWNTDIARFVIPIFMGMTDTNKTDEVCKFAKKFCQTAFGCFIKTDAVCRLKMSFSLSFPRKRESMFTKKFFLHFAFKRNNVRDYINIKSGSPLSRG
jgi:hypothetical protein